VQFVTSENERWPNVKENAVPMESFMRPPPRLENTDAGESFGEHAFQVRQLHNAPMLVFDRGHIAHLGARKEPLVFGIVTGHHAEQINIFH
jgi:hypothetical protein